VLQDLRAEVRELHREIDKLWGHVRELSER
jgi:hypothetical protein